MTKRRKIKLPTLAQVQTALPLVSAAFGFLSAMPFNKNVAKTLSAAAAATSLGGSAPQQPQGPLKDDPVKQRLRETLLALESATAETPKERLIELTSQALTLARVMVEK